MAITHDTQVVSSGLARLAKQLRNSVSHAQLLTALLGEAQALEDALFGLASIYDPDALSGAQLDTLGALVGEPRAGRLDAAYRLGIRARVRVNRSSGTSEDVFGALQLALASYGVSSATVAELFPASGEVQIFPALPFSITNALSLLSLLTAARAAGVKLALHFSPNGAANDFVLPFSVSLNASIVGATVLNITGDASTFPLAGSAVLDDSSASNAETVTFTRVGSRLYVSATSKAHAAFGTATFIDSGLGLGDTSNPSTGGRLTSVI